MATASEPQAGIDLDWLRAKIPYSLYQDCIHCGLCTASCPTYVETGDENDSPRGRIYLMRAVADGRIGASPEVRHHLDLCLDCRACETACPSGVQYGRLIEPFKVALHASSPPEDRTGWMQQVILQYLFPYGNRVKIALAPARWLQKLGILDRIESVGLMKLLPATLRQMQAMLPTLATPGPTLPAVLPAIGPKRATVGLFVGCVGDAMFPGTTAATARVLQANGCEVHIPRGQNCCGAIHYHSGSEGPAVAFARRNITALDPDRFDAIVTNVAGCGAMLKDYHHLLPPADHDRAVAFISKVRDISEFLMNLGPIAPTHPVPIRATYHDPCHLAHAQQIKAAPRELLGLIPGLELVPLAESDLCCGAAGTYNLTQPEMADRLGRRKLANIRATGAGTVVTGNVGCILQIARQAKAEGAPIEVVHPVDLLDRAYRGPSNP